MNPTVGPLGMTCFAVLTSGDCYGRRFLERIRDIDRWRASIAIIGLPSLDFGNQKRVAGPIGDGGELKKAVREKDAVTAPKSCWLENKPRSVIKTVVGRKQTRTPGSVVPYLARSRIAWALKDRNRQIVDRHLKIPSGREIDSIVEDRCFELRQDPTMNTPTAVVEQGRIAVINHYRWRQPFVRTLVIGNRETDLTEIAGAGHAPRRFSRSLYRWQEQADQHTDDGDDDKKLYEGETARMRSSSHG